MLEYIAYRKFKKNRDRKVEERAKLQEEAETARARSKSPTASSLGPGPGPVLTDDEQLFFERLTSEDGFSDENGKRPPLPPRVKTPDVSWDSDNDSYVRSEDLEVKGKGKGKGKPGDGSKGDGKQPSRFSFFTRKTGKTDLQPTNLAVPHDEEAREKDDINRILDDLNLSARNNKTFSLSKDSAEMVGKFTVVLQDLVNGVPTATNDLKKLFDDHDGTLAKNYEKLPKSMQKMVTTLPTKVTGALAPELLAVAAESQGLKGDDAPKGGIKDQAMKLLVPKNLSELVTKPSAVVGMLKAIMNFLKVRWPAFIGTNAIWSIALFLLMFVLWYCHKRGREVRLEREKSASAVEAGSRIEELSDDDSVVESRSGRASPKRIESAGASSRRKK
ncbi:ring-like domain-containing protein [Diaporthe eres]|uniref:Ring-like domain-containing protein n=1 Tax=Diaporthe vaccinii TaxID=105482 RepID=A0ABR4EGL7_9PEZI|nr:ring-like domain-containing protein [Diaporthe eres]